MIFPQSVGIHILLLYTVYQKNAVFCVLNVFFFTCIHQIVMVEVKNSFLDLSGIVMPGLITCKIQVKIQSRRNQAGVLVT